MPKFPERIREEYKGKPDPKTKYEALIFIKDAMIASIKNAETLDEVIVDTKKHLITIDMMRDNFDRLKDK